MPVHLLPNCDNSYGILSKFNDWENIQVIPWTVNDASNMRKLVTMGVDGLITDYPDLGVRVLAEIQQAQ